MTIEEEKQKKIDLAKGWVPKEKGVNWKVSEPKKRSPKKVQPY